MRRFIGCLVAIVLASYASSGDARIVTTKILLKQQLSTGSPVVPMTLEFEGPPRTFATEACLSFFNGSATPAKAVRIGFVFYDAGGDRVAQAALVRTGSFAPRALATPNVATARDHHPDCQSLPTGRDFAAVVYYIDHVEFADGTAWTSKPLTIADHLGPPYAATNPPPAPPASGSSDAHDLPPVIAGTYAGCADAQNAKVGPTPLFTGTAPAPLAPDRNVMVTVEPGAPDGTGLSRIGTATVCRSSGDAGRDAAAVAFAHDQPDAISAAEVFRVYFPAVPALTSCTEPVRLMRRVLDNLAYRTGEDRAPAGNYDILVRVNVRPDGFPSGVSIVKGSGRRTFDDAALRSALSTRYWPALVRGAPAASTYDFPMRWVVTNTQQSALGPAAEPPAASCLAAN